MTEYIALFRGINVGRARRIAMADLRELLLDLGHGNVRTLLNSGNALFQCARPNPAKLALAIQKTIEDRCAFSTQVTVMTVENLTAIARENPLVSVAKDPARHLVAFVAHPRSLAPLRPLSAQNWSPDALAFGSRAAYLWCAGGVLDSKLLQAFSRCAGDSVTTRNWATVLKLLDAAKASA